MLHKHLPRCLLFPESSVYSLGSPFPPCCLLMLVFFKGLALLVWALAFLSAVCRFCLYITSPLWGMVANLWKNGVCLVIPNKLHQLIYGLKHWLTSPSDWTKVDQNNLKTLNVHLWSVSWIMKPGPNLWNEMENNGSGFCTTVKCVALFRTKFWKNLSNTKESRTLSVINRQMIHICWSCQIWQDVVFYIHLKMTF